MHIRGDHAELVVGGRLDVRSAADARTSLHTALDGGQGDLVLDLGALDSWDATGLGVIMGAHRRAGRCGRRLVLRSVPPQMQRLLVATRLHRILAIEGAAIGAPRDGGDTASGMFPGEVRESQQHLGQAYESRSNRPERYERYKRYEQYNRYEGTHAHAAGVHERQRAEYPALDDGGQDGGTLTKP